MRKGSAMSSNRTNPSFLFHISLDFPELAKEEIESLLNVETTIFSHRFLSASLSSKTNLETLQSLFSRFGLVKTVLLREQKFVCSSLENLVSQIDPTIFRNDFKISILNEQKNNKKENKNKKCRQDVFSPKELADALFHRFENEGLSFPRVDLKTPKQHVIIVLRDNTTDENNNPKNNTNTFIADVCEEIFSNKEEFDTRRSHLLKWNHPTSTHPKISRAMINLASSTSFHDPFCGSGGLILEGLLMSLEVSGSDVSKPMIGRARENLSSFDFHPRLEVLDALSCKGRYEAIITDLPFGKNSFLSAERKQLYLDFLKHAETCTDTLVLGFENDALIPSDIKQNNLSWSLVRSFSYYVHKSMRRTIWLLKK